jgi:hypothetical protein
VWLGANNRGYRAQGDFSTTFPANEDPISQGGIWLNGADDGLDWHNIKTLSGTFAATHLQPGGADDDCIAVLKPSFRQFTANQFVQGTALRTPGYTQQHEILLLLRFSISANVAKGYEVYWTTAGGGAIQLVRWNGALHDFSLLANAGLALPTTGDTLRASITGAVITVSFNGGASSLTFDDSANVIATGNPGMGNNPGVTPSTLTDMGWTAILAGNI